MSVLSRADGAMRLRGSDCVARAEAAPVSTVDDDRGVDLLHHHEFAATHIASIEMDEPGVRVACGGKPGAVVEDALVAAVRSVPHRVVRPLRLRIDAVVDGQIAVQVDRAAERHALVRSLDAL